MFAKETGTQLERPVRDPMLGLSGMVRVADGCFALIFVIYENPKQRPGLIDRLSRTVPEMKFVEVSLEDPTLDPHNGYGTFFDQLRQIAERNSNGEVFSAVLLLDWEKRLEMNKRSYLHPITTLLGVFNAQREALRDALGCPCIVLVPLSAYKTLLTQARDFAGVRSGSYIFPAEGSDIDGPIGHGESP